MQKENMSMLKPAGLRVRQNQKAWKYIRDLNIGTSSSLNRTAIEEGPVKYTYGMMFRQWERYASVFTALGMTGREHVRAGLHGRPAVGL